MLIHGGGAGAAVWYRQIAALKDSYRVLAPDSPVFGLSSQPSVPTPLRQFAREYVQGFIEALQLEPVRIAGLSVGGFIALAQAVDRSPRIRSMVLIDSAGLGSDLPWVFRLLALPVFGHAVSLPRKFMQDYFFDIKLVADSRGRESEPFKRYAFETTRLEGHALSIRRHAPEFANLRGQKLVFSDDELRRNRYSDGHHLGSAGPVLPRGARRTRPPDDTRFGATPDKRRRPRLHLGPT